MTTEDKGKRGRKRTRVDGRSICVWLPSPTLERLEQLAKSSGSVGAAITEAVKALDASPDDLARQLMARRKLDLIRSILDDE